MNDQLFIVHILYLEYGRTRRKSACNVNQEKTRDINKSNGSWQEMY